MTAPLEAATRAATIEGCSWGTSEDFFRFSLPPLFAFGFGPFLLFVFGIGGNKLVIGSPGNRMTLFKHRIAFFCLWKFQ
jgi:hypothetical protein